MKIKFISLIIFIIILANIIIFSETKNLLLKKFLVYGFEEISIVSGVVPHHLVADKIIEKFFQYIASKEKPRTIILLGPDHFKSTLVIGKPFVTVDLNVKKFHNLPINNYLLQKLINYNNLGLKSSALNFDHSITNLLPYIRKYFPESSILPIIISFKASREEIEELIKTINNYTDPQTIIVASVDFSHYLPPEVADFHDIKSISTLIDFKEDDFENLEVDSWQSLYGARFFAKLRNREKAYIIGRGKSSDFLNSNDYSEEGITSYFSVVFGKEEYLANFEKGKTILFVGNIMLDRNIKALMEKNGLKYPFQKIQRLFKGVDIVVGNLEGLIIEKPQKSTDHSSIFNFSPQIVEVLSWANLKLLSLANNHIFDRGELAFNQTKAYLKKAKINFVGHPIECKKNSLFEKDDIIFLAFNKTFPFNCSDKKIVKIVKEISELNPEKFLIVIFHWGEEYKETSSFEQQKLAHQVIDAGADLIIGYHPNVVQEIEEYKGKLIFYSLGNFIFDQYFSKETQEGLAVGLEIYPKKVIYRLFPIQIKLSQPFLMKKEEANKFLEKLAQKSSSQLFDKIKSGIIEIKKTK